MIKQLNLINKKKLSLCYINNKRVLVLDLNKDSSYYRALPSSFSISKKQKPSIELESNSLRKKDFISYISKLQQSFYVSFKVLIFSGLGLKAKLDLDAFILELKLGYSHLCIINLDKEINIRVKKNIILLQSYNKVKLGNFAFRIKSLRFPDIYRGKGILYKNESLNLKVVKKK